MEPKVCGFHFNKTHPASEVFNKSYMLFKALVKTNNIILLKKYIFDMHQKILRCGITVLPKVPHEIAQDFFLGRTVFMAPGQLCKN